MINKQYLSQLATSHRVPLTDAMLGQFDSYAALLADWNSRVNLTAITAPDEIAVKHFLDSLLLLTAVTLPEGAAVIDVGTGAGFPGVPLKIARPDLSVTLLDSLNKRVGFLTEVSRRLGLDLTCIHGRAEELARDKAHRERYDLAAARAVAALPVLAEYCLPFVRHGGLFAAMKGREAGAEAESAARAARLLGGAPPSLAYKTLPDGAERAFILIKKISQTPPKYPRTAGKPAKDPL